MTTLRYLVTKRFGVTILAKDERNLWVAVEGPLAGCVFALRDDEQTLDIVDRCGISPFVLPINTPLDEICAIHDNLYQNPAYQLFHTRKEADDMLKHLIKMGMKDSWLQIFRSPFRWLARRFGGSAWENEKTR